MDPLFSLSESGFQSLSSFFLRRLIRPLPSLSLYLGGGLWAFEGFEWPSRGIRDDLTEEIKAFGIGKGLFHR